MRILMGALAMMTMGCAPVPPAEPEPPVHGGADRECDSGPAQHLVGRESSQELGGEIMRLTGASAFRWVPEGAVITMDYREDRVNVKLDRRNRVAGISCG